MSFRLDRDWRWPRGGGRFTRAGAVPLAVSLVALLISASGVWAAAPVFNEFALPAGSDSAPWEVAAGPDGNLWVSEAGKGKLARVSLQDQGAPVITEFPLPAGAGSVPWGLAAGPDGNVWVSEYGQGNVARVGLHGQDAPVITEFPLPSGVNSNPLGMAAGPDGSLWVTELTKGKVAQVTPQAAGDPVITEFALPGGASTFPSGLAAGPDGNLWVAEPGVGKVAQIIPPQGQDPPVITEFALPSGVNSGPSGVAAGPDGNIWVTEGGARNVARITPHGQDPPDITEFALPSGATSNPWRVAAGPDGNLWITERSGNLARMTPQGHVDEFSLPSGGDSDPIGLAMGPDGNLWVSDTGVGTVARVELLPGARTGAADSVDTSSARLSGGVDPSGQATSYRFEYGPTTSYGSETPHADAGSDQGETPVTASLSGLNSNTSYHYRLVATNRSGTTYGQDHVFTTQAVPAPPAPPVPAPADVSPHSRIIRPASAAAGRVPAGRRLTVAGAASDDHGVRWVDVSLTRLVRRGSRRACQRFSDRGLWVTYRPTARGSCPPRFALRARRTTRWTLVLPKLFKGRYTLTSSATDTAGQRERLFSARRGNQRSLTVR